MLGFVSSKFCEHKYVWVFGVLCPTPTVFFLRLFLSYDFSVVTKSPLRELGWHQAVPLPFSVG